MNIEIKEKHFLILVGLLALVSVIGIATGQTAPNPGHAADSVGPGTFPGSGDYIFPTNTKVKFGSSGQVSMYYNGTALIIEG